MRKSRYRLPRRCGKPRSAPRYCQSTYPHHNSGLHVTKSIVPNVTQKPRIPESRLF